MSALSWRWSFRRRGSASSEEKKGSSDDEWIMEEFGVTEQLCEFVSGFNVSTFKDFPLQDRSEEPISATVTSTVRKDLTEWQERHASLVLSKVKEISQLRYTLCPRLLKEQQFWRIYFLLVKTYVTPYEIRALQKAKIKKISSEDNISAKKSGIEVEMIESKNPSGSSLLTQ
ncbi:uncharacterized protein LOC120257983 [Dioscorea cayenensis subsp. rotundata]|uniref:Uncharacterized protein LOC120257983 n=1 Tax=Dioscorea cayennensis subsp. rotundata TaxID=55577 RepID=A0AB40B240_DIOCR|nr:uncharacterized protein LOC120257983 [Dioscorea cayenensis subsp. rotundata]